MAIDVEALLAAEHAETLARFEAQFGTAPN